MSKSMKRLSITNLEESYKDTPGAMIVNALNDADGRTMGDHIKAVLTDISTDISFTASCECKEFIGNAYLGRVCPYCSTTVSSNFTNKLSNVQWLAVPDHLPPLIHPVFYAMFSEILGKTATIRDNRSCKVPIIQIVLDPGCKVPDQLKHLIRGQGFDYFYKNYNEILEHYFQIADKARNTKQGKMKKYKVDALRYLLDTYKDAIFTRYLPILHASLHPVGSEGMSKVVDKGSTLILPVIADLSALASSSKRSLTSKKANIQSLWKIFEGYIDYTNNIIVHKLGEKEAHFRKHGVGSRLHSSARAVITPIVVPHEYDEVHIPFKIVVKAYEWEIKNLLINRGGYSNDSSAIKFMRALTRFDKDIFDILEVLKKESGFKGNPVIMGRNPSLGIGSEFLLWNTIIKKDMKDNTISFSARICPPLNADFDGDEAYLIFIKEQNMVRALRNLDPKECILSMSKLAVSDQIRVTEQAILHLNSFVTESYDVDPNQEYVFPGAIKDKYSIAV